MTPEERRAAQEATAWLLVATGLRLAKGATLDNPWHLDELAVDAARLDDKVRMALAAML